MPPPPRSAAPSVAREALRTRPPRPSPPPPQPSLESNALFLPEADDDRRWDPSGYGDEEEEMLAWDASADNVRTPRAIVLCFKLKRGTGRTVCDA